MSDESSNEKVSEGEPLTFTREGDTGLAEARRSELPGETLKLHHTVFQSVTNMAPAAAIVYDFPLQAGRATAVPTQARHRPRADPQGMTGRANLTRPVGGGVKAGGRGLTSHPCRRARGRRRSGRPRVPNRCWHKAE